MDKSLMNAPTFTDPVQKIMNRQNFENANQTTSDGGNCELMGNCKMAKNPEGNRLNTYKNYVKNSEQAQAQHQQFQATAQGSQVATGSAFDTTLDRYSPNVAQVINF